LSPPDSTAEKRRFVHDENLISILRNLAKHARLRELNLHFHGRRRVERTDELFLNHMKRVKADSVQFRLYVSEYTGWSTSGYGHERAPDPRVKSMLLMGCERRKKLFTN
jgi:hypothetical protein